MRISFKCPHCQAEGKAPEQFAGRKVKCPKCQSAIPLPPLPPTRPINVATPSEPTKPIRGRLTDRVAPWLAIVAALTFLFTLRQAGWIALAHYSALVVGILAAGALLRRRIAHKLVMPIAWIVAAGSAMAWWQVDYSKKYWHRSVDGVDMDFADYTRRGESHPFYREVWYGDELGAHASKLGFSESGKQHGPYSDHISMPPKERHATLEAMGYELDRFGYGANLSEWYWYGEEISEGEWHLRNR